MAGLMELMDIITVGGLSRYVQKLIICTVMRILVVMVHVGMQQLPELIIPVIRIQAFFLKNILLILVTMLLIFIYTRFAKIEDMEVV